MAVPRPIKILVVDDDRRLNRSIEFNLSKAGFIAKTAFDGESALKILEKEAFDLIILDLVMPGMPGFDVLRAVKSKYPKTSVAVLSMLRQEEDVARAKELGADEYFTKVHTFVGEIVRYAEKVSQSDGPS